MSRLRILPEVYQDIDEASSWYDNQTMDVEVADRLAAIFRKSLAKIRNGGETRRVVYAGFRKIALSPFPHQVFYRLADDVWVVALIAHSARDPKNIHRLLDDRDSRI